MPHKLTSAEEWAKASLRERLIERISCLQTEVDIISQEIASEGMVPSVWMTKRLDCIALAAASIRTELAAGRKPGLWMEEQLDDIYTASDALLVRLTATTPTIGKHVRRWLMKVGAVWQRLATRCRGTLGRIRRANRQ